MFVYRSIVPGLFYLNVVGCKVVRQYVDSAVGAGVLSERSGM